MSAEALSRAAERARVRAGRPGLAHITPEGCALMERIFAHAAAIAAEAEYAAKWTSDEAMSHVEPKYPPLVAMLIEAATLSDQQAAGAAERAALRAGART